MAITSAICTSFKKELLEGLMDFNASSGSTFKIALIKANASQSGTYSAATTNYSDVTGNSDELPATGGYTSGGNTLTNIDPTTSGTTAFVDFADTSWTSATFTTRGCIIYNTSQSNKAVMVIDFGADFSVSGGTFQIQFPTANASDAILRIA
ncbi:MAG: hypothetical protein CMI74_09595 [Candidatus Pelagibacter sp.]|mgnify:FL=1|jgi:hypothetical protein|nr:hypothetical protein [Candidatus Pelagibacter sp.]|tara:strand:- start:21 stop:476 length:456 start_codon:yes stop_codon:yes gene_type:complete